MWNPWPREWSCLRGEWDQGCQQDGSDEDDSDDGDGVDSSGVHNDNR